MPPRPTSTSATAGSPKKTSRRAVSETPDSPMPAHSEDLTPDLVIGDLRDNDELPVGEQVVQPGVAASAFQRWSGIRGQAKRAAIKHDNQSSPSTAFED